MSTLGTRVGDGFTPFGVIVGGDCSRAGAVICRIIASVAPGPTAGVMNCSPFCRNVPLKIGRDANPIAAGSVLARESSISEGVGASSTLSQRRPSPAFHPARVVLHDLDR